MDAEKFAEHLGQINEQADGRSCDDLFFRPSMAAPGCADIHMQSNNLWVARVPGDLASLDVLEALSRAVSFGTTLGIVIGKRQIGDFLRDECGL